MDNIWTLMDIIFVGAGGYMLYAWFLMTKKGEIKKEVLMNKEVNLKKCKDLEGYKSFMAPKMLVFAIGSLLYGAAGLINSYVTPVPSIAYNVLMVAFLVVLLWYAFTTKKATERFW